MYSPILKTIRHILPFPKDPYSSDDKSCVVYQIPALTVTMFILVKSNVALSYDWPIIGEPQAN